MNPRQLARSIVYALRGFVYALRYERNIRIQLSCACVVIAVGFFFHISGHEWLIVISLIVAVLTMELINTSMEKYMDVVKPRLHEQVETVKNVMAAAVLLVSVFAFAVGLVIFMPHITQWYVELF